MSAEEANVTSSDGGAAILTALQTDLDPSKARTVDACLCHVFRSKHRPAPAVQPLLADLNSDHVRAAYRILTQDYLSNESSCLSFMKRVATIVWFVQLLLESRSMQGSSESALSEAEANKMALSLLQNLPKSVTALLKRWKDDGVEAISDDGHEMDLNEFHAPTVAYFSIGAYLRAVDPYVSCRPFLLSPLWKGIGDIASQLTSLPFDLAVKTLKALLGYLYEGESQTMATLTQYVESCPSESLAQQHEFQVKVLIFLVARVAILLRVQSRKDDKAKEVAVLDHAASVLLRLRGLTLATEAQLRNKDSSRSSALTEQDRSFLKAYEQLEIRVEECIVNSWLRSSKPEGSIFDRHDLNQFLRLKHQHAASRGVQKHLMSSSFAFGKTLVLQRLLQQTVAQVTSTVDTLSDSDNQSLLFLCQELLFSTLPLVQSFDPSTTLLSTCLVTMVSATVVCGTRASTDNRSQLHRLLVRWLTPPSGGNLHPLTRELLVSLIHLYILRMCQVYQSAVQSGSPRSVDLRETANGVERVAGPVKSMISLLVKLLFDPRTQSGLRRNIAGTVTRLLGSQTEAVDSVEQHVSGFLQQAIAVEFEQYLKQDIKAERRKRKQRNAPSKQVDAMNCRPLGSLPFQDVNTMLEVLKQISTFNVPSLDRELASLSRDLSDFDSNTKPQAYNLGHRSRNASSLLLSLLCGILEIIPGNENQQSLECFHQKTGTNIENFRSDLLQWLVSQQKRAGRSEGKVEIVRKGRSAIITTCLFFVRSSFALAQTSTEELQAIVSLVSEYAREANQVLRATRPLFDSDERSGAVSIVFAITQLLDRIAGAIPISCPSDILQVGFILRNDFGGEYALTLCTSPL